MRATTQGRVAVPPWAMAVAAMFSVQLSSSLSVRLFDSVGTGGAAWLRLTMGALIFVAVARPPLRSVRRRDLLPLLGLGVATGLMTTSFLAAIDRIPLGTAVAIEFLGPLTVAGLRSSDRRALIWPGLAMIGVLLLTEPWHGHVELAGVGFAALAGAGWGTYILLTQRVGDRFTGIGSLAMTVPIAAVVTAAVGVPQAAGHLTPQILLAALGLAVLMPVLPFVFELLALRKMTHTAFGTLMALEPAAGLLMGVVVLHQLPDPVQLLGILLVVLAGAGAQRNGLRGTTDESTPESLLDPV